MLYFYFQNAMFYVLSDDIVLSKQLLKEKINANFYITFPGDGRNNRPGNSIEIAYLFAQNVILYVQTLYW